jgi:hypothetical protein
VVRRESRVIGCRAAINRNFVAPSQQGAIRLPSHTWQGLNLGAPAGSLRRRGDRRTRQIGHCNLNFCFRWRELP